MAGTAALHAALVERLEGSVPHVRGALDLGAARREQIPLPAAFVAVVNDVPASTSETAAGAVQVLDTTLAILLIAAAKNDRTGGARTRDSLSALIDDSRARLLGWRPEGCATVLVFQRGRLLELEDGRAIWSDEYRVRRILAAGAVTGAPA